MTWDAVGVAGGREILWDMALRAVAAEDTSPGFSGIWLRLMVSKGRVVAGVTMLLFLGRILGVLMFEVGLDE